ncbi:hypothetical protein FUT88_13365 [Ralstonia sp. TCR112]|uniref:hypothetical protein n=1 Tax=Ralstonia sp. TCR112 TaxID=2601730 RepID=UPI0011BDCE83|nr:hypothetical protein [Ralstonia sp. TCR112]TXD58861.1 hypothetical protein FUT88_13365 [Ralstonia sp. TCR112]
MFEAYKIGVRISLINHASMGLAALSKDFMKTEEQAARLQKRIDSIKNQALKGGLMLGLAGGLGGLLKAPYEEAKKLEQERQKFNVLNLSAADNARAFAQAQTLAHKNLGTTIGENIALITDLHTALGDLPKALQMSEDFQKFSIAAKIQNDGKPVEGLVYNAVKALEHRGDRVAQSPAEMKRELDMMSKVYFGSRGKVGPNDYFHASQTGKLAYTLFDPEFLFGQFAAFMQSKTGPTAGTSAMTYVSSLLGGHMDNKAKGFMTSLGLWDMSVSPQAKLMQNAVNDAIKQDPSIAGALKKMHMLTPVVGGLAPQFLEMASRRPDEFIQKVVAPRIRERFGMDLTDEQVAGIIMRNFNRSTADFIGSFITSEHKYEKDARIFENSKGFGAAYQQYIKSPEGAEVAADAAWRNFLAMFGSVYLPVITKGLIKIAGALDSLSQSVEHHPGVFRALAYALGLVSVGLGLRGGGLLLSAAFRGLGLALAMQTAGGAAGILKIAGAIGGAGNTALVGALGALLSPVGLAVAALGTLALAAYAFRPMSQSEIDSYKDQGGARLTPGAQARVNAGELNGGGYVKTKQQQPLNLTASIYLDRTKLGDALVSYMADGLSKPQTGRSGTDMTMSPLPIGHNYAR